MTTPRSPSFPAYASSLAVRRLPTSTPAAHPFGADHFHDGPRPHSLSDLHDSLEPDASSHSQATTPPDSPQSSISSHVRLSACRQGRAITLCSISSRPARPSGRRHPQALISMRTPHTCAWLALNRLTATQPILIITGISPVSHPPKCILLILIARALPAEFPSFPSKDLRHRHSPAALLDLAHAASVRAQVDGYMSAENGTRRHTIDTTNPSRRSQPRSLTQYRRHQSPYSKTALLPSVPSLHNRHSSLPDYAPVPSYYPGAAYVAIQAPSLAVAPSRRPSISLSTHALPTPGSPSLETARPRSRVPTLAGGLAGALTDSPPSLVVELAADSLEVPKYKDATGRITSPASKSSTGKYGCPYCSKRFNRPSSLKVAHPFRRR